MIISKVRTEKRTKNIERKFMNWVFSSNENFIQSMEKILYEWRNQKYRRRIEIERGPLNWSTLEKAAIYRIQVYMFHEKIKTFLYSILYNYGWMYWKFIGNVEPKNIKFISWGSSANVTIREIWTQNYFGKKKIKNEIWSRNRLSK